MTAARRGHFQSRPRGQEGFTLIEMMVVMIILGVVLGICFGFLASIQRAENNDENRSQSNDQARLAAQQIDRQVRSASVIYDPAQEVSGGVNYAGTNPDGSAIAAGFSLRVYTQANATSLCDQWRLLNTGALQTRTWSPTWQTDGKVTGWRPVATKIVNTSSQAPFALDTSAGNLYQGRLLDLDLWAQALSGSGQNVELKNSVAGRNSTGSTSTICTPIPAP